MLGNECNCRSREQTAFKQIAKVKEMNEQNYMVKLMLTAPTSGKVRVQNELSTSCINRSE